MAYLEKVRKGKFFISYGMTNGLKYATWFYCDKATQGDIDRMIAEEFPNADRDALNSLPGIANCSLSTAKDLNVPPT